MTELKDCKTQAEVLRWLSMMHAGDLQNFVGDQALTRMAEIADNAGYRRGVIAASDYVDKQGDGLLSGQIAEHLLTTKGSE